MSVPAGTPVNDEIARVAYAIWQAEGPPEGCDHEHWMRARQLIEEGRAEIEFPQAAAPREGDAHAPRPVQPGFEDAAPGMVPVMKDEPGEELREEPGQAKGDRAGRPDIPGPRNPDPEPATNAEGYVAVPSSEELAGAPINDDPQPRAPEPQSKRGRAKVPAAL